MATYPKDQFDDVPTDTARVGAHRGAIRRGSGWITFAWAALATGVLVAAGVFAVSVLGDTGTTDLGDTPVASATAEPTVAPVTDPTTIDSDRDISITILNGTSFAGLAETADKALTKLKWPVGSTADADASTYKTTTVYYSNTADEDVALGVAAALKVGTAKLDTTMQGAPIKVVLGTDYETLVGKK